MAQLLLGFNSWQLAEGGNAEEYPYLHALTTLDCPFDPIRIAVFGLSLSVGRSRSQMQVVVLVVYVYIHLVPASICTVYFPYLMAVCN